MFLTTAQTTFNAVFQLLLIAVAAGILIRKNSVSKEQVHSLSVITVNVFLPCLILSKTLARFDPQSLGFWWALPLTGLFLVLSGMGFAALLFGFKPSGKPLLPLASMQNSIYIVLPIGQILYPDQFDLFALYAFLLTMGLTPLMWSVGKVLISGGKNTRIQWQDFISPPLVATLTSLVLVFSGLSSSLPTVIMGPVNLLGSATVPLAVFILGATLSTISFTDMPAGRDILVVAAVKFGILPLMVFAALYSTQLYHTMPLLCSLLIIQASAPPATNLILIVKSYGGDSQSIGSMMLVQYLICIIAMPLWLALWQFVTH